MTAPRSAAPWKFVGLASLAVNVALVAWLAVSSGGAPAAAPGKTEASSAGGAKPAAVPRELQPYAALGSYLAEHNRIADLQWTPAQFEAFQAGVRGTYEGRGFPLDDDAARLREDVNRRVQAMIEGQRPDPVGNYFRTLREKEGVKQTASGLHYRVTETGRGAPPSADATVVVSFTAQLPDGQKLPAFQRVRATVKLGELLPGLSEGLRLLAVGGKALLYLPPPLSFGDKTWPADVPRGAPLVFFIELHDVKE